MTMRLLRLAGLAFLALAFVRSADAQTNVFLMPALFPRHLQLAETFKRQLRQQDFSAMEQTCRAGVALLPDDPTWRYNLACTLARQARQQEALDALGEAIDRGFRDVRMITGDPDLATLRRLRRFRELLDRAGALQGRPAAGQAPLAPAPVTDHALVSASNTTWNFDIGCFQTFFTFPKRPPADTPLPSNRWVRLPGPAGEALRRWQAEGTAAGNAGDLYDNRDDGHSTLNLALFPELRPIRYDAPARAARVATGLSRFSFNGIPVLGNSSTANRTGPFWRSNARQAYADGHAMLLLSLQYLRNQHYVYPQHQDYREEVQGDTFPANTPYLTIAPGSSYTDRPLLEAFAAALAALRPEVKAELVRQGMLMPTLQMLLRMSQKDVRERADYLTPKAHPVVFSGATLDAARLVAQAHDLRTNALPPFAAIRMLEETPALAGRDFFDLATSESLFDSPAAIARIARGMDYTRRFALDGRGSRNPVTSRMKAHWVLLQGDPAKVRIRPRVGETLVADIEIDYHGGGFTNAAARMRTSRVDIALIVDNDAHFSPPAYFTVYYLNNEIRTYSDSRQILSVDYGGAAHRYTDPMISWPRRWRDDYIYDGQGRLLGWTRLREERREDFAWDGARILTRDDGGRPLTARVVSYLPREGRDPQDAPTLEVLPIDTDRVRTYVYDSDDDPVGAVARETIQPATGD
ncbi:MAG: hypothetical protein GX590_03590 [Lentisphaerae bacterium]|nr:hypothetical protein [Lentisphaerota bacterium]